MISEQKKEIVINNYFESECDINTTLKEAYTKGFNRGLQKAPKAKWIPVETALPGSGFEVIVSCHDDSGDSAYDYTSVGWMTPGREYWIVDGEINSFVIAWMSLPEYYKKEVKSDVD